MTAPTEPGWYRVRLRAGDHGECVRLERDAYVLTVHGERIPAASVAVWGEPVEFEPEPPTIEQAFRELERKVHSGKDWVDDWDALRDAIQRGVVR